MGYILLFLIGFGLAVSGGVTMIAYLNFLPAGISWMEYFHYISTRMECYFFPAGLLMILISIYRLPKNIFNEAD